MSAQPIRSLRYEATCAVCGRPLPPGTRAVWDKERAAATCESCLHVLDGATLDRGQPGASAFREAQRRRQESWLQGSRGEQELGKALEELCEEGLGVLHDRRIPGSKANIDHLVIGPAGVFVIDTKLYTGKIERRTRGWFLSREPQLYVKGRQRTKLVNAMARQVEAARCALATTSHPNCPVFPAMCFVESDWGIWGAPFLIGDVRVLWPKKLGKLVRSDGPLSRDEIAGLERALALALPPA